MQTNGPPLREYTPMYREFNLQRVAKDPDLAAKWARDDAIKTAKDYAAAARVSLRQRDMHGAVAALLSAVEALS